MTQLHRRHQLYRVIQHSHLRTATAGARGGQTYVKNIVCGFEPRTAWSKGVAVHRPSLTLENRLPNPTPAFLQRRGEERKTDPCGLGRRSPVSATDEARE